MAARGENLGVVTLTMLAFGIGTATPLLLLATLTREVLIRWRGKILNAAVAGKVMLGLLLIAAGTLTLTGLDRTIQTALEQALPDWLVAVTTRI